jgi:hypothetical protein
MGKGVGDRLAPTVTFPLAEGPPLDEDACRAKSPRMVYVPAGNVPEAVAVSEIWTGGPAEKAW